MHREVSEVNDYFEEERASAHFALIYKHVYLSIIAKHSACYYINGNSGNDVENGENNNIKFHSVVVYTCKIYQQYVFSTTIITLSNMVSRSPPIIQQINQSFIQLP